MNALTRRKLEWLLRARGPDLSTWPERERLAALALLRRSADARQALADALVGEDAPETDCAVLRRMQSVLRRKLAPVSLLLRGVAAGALLACMAAGCYFAVSQVDPDPDMFASAQSVSFAAIDP